MDKGKSKTDLRAAGKKRLEEFRQKRQQKGSSTKPSSTTALKALTESEREISRRDSLLKDEAQRSSQNDGEVEAVVNHAHGDALEERHEVDVVFDASSGSSVTSPIQTLEVVGPLLTPETSEQSGESLRELGSSNGNLEDEDREAVYTVLWENDGTEHSQRSEDWQDSTFDGGTRFNERELHHENDSSFWVDNEIYRSASKEGSSTQRMLSGNSLDAADKFQSSQSVQGMLQARDMELMDAMSKLEGATRVISEREEEAKAYVEQNERLKEELMKCHEDLGMLKSNVSMAEEKMVGLKNELQDVIDSFGGVPEDRSSQIEGVTLSLNEMVTEVNSLAKLIAEQARRRELELRSGNERAVAALLLESNSSKERLAKLEQEVRDSRNAAQDIGWLYEASPPQSSLLDWVTWLIDVLQSEHRKSEQDFQVIESMTMTANENAVEVQRLQEKIDSLHAELSNEREAVAEELRRRDVELQSERDKLRELAVHVLALEAEVESARSLCRVENALIGIDEIVGDFGFQGRPSSASSPSEWISWLIQIFREVSRELQTSKIASDVLSLQVEEAKNNHSSLYEELLSQKNDNVNLQVKHRDVHEMFGVERDSLKAEIQVLKDSCVEVSGREFEFSEAHKAVANLQETLALKDRELSRLHDKTDALFLESAQRDTRIQSVQGMLQARDMELMDAMSKLEGATRVISEREEEAKAYVEQNERLKEELMKCHEDLGMLKSNVSMAEEKMVGLKNELQDVIDSFGGVPEDRSSQIEGVTLSLNEMVTEVNSLAKLIAEQARRRELELRSGNERAVAALLLESNSSKERLAKLEQEVRDSRNAAQDIGWLYEASPPQSSLLDWVTWLIDVLQSEHRKSEQDFQVIESMTMTANENAVEVQRLQEKIDSLHAELSNEREAVAEELRRRDVELQSERDKLRELAVHVLALEAEVESARSLCRVENALIGIDEIVGDFGFQGRPSSASSPSEWISWLIQIFREVSRELQTSKIASDVLSLQVEEAKNNHSSLYEELLSQKNDNVNLQVKHRDVHEMFGVERDSLKAEIQVLKDSCVEVSGREFEFSEAHKAVANLQETLALKDRELSRLHDKTDALFLESAQRDTRIQCLMDEQDRLSSELLDIKDERNLLLSEVAQISVEKSNLHSDVNQLEQKLVAVREKLNLAIMKGKGLVKQRDSLKKSMTEDAARLESIVSSHANDIMLKDSELLEIRAEAEIMGSRIQELQAEVSSLFEKATASQHRMEADRQRLENVFSGIDFPKHVLPRDTVEKVNWLVSLVDDSRKTTKFLEGELASSRNALETLKAVLRDTEERLQSVTFENLRAQEEASIAVKKVEEVESRATLAISLCRNEVDELTKTLKESDLRQQAAWSRVMECEKTLEKRQNFIIASEAAHSKAVTKLSFTRNKLNLLVQDSQELVRECESLHKSLQEREIEIVELKREVDELKNIIHVEQSQRLDAGSKTSLQLTLLQEELARANEKSAATVKDLQEGQVALHCILKEKDSSLEVFRTKIEDILLKGDNDLWMERNIVHQNKGVDGVADIDVKSMNGRLDFDFAVTTLEQRFNNLFAEAQLLRKNNDEKEAEIQKLKEELHNVSIERTTLEEGVRVKTMEVEKLRSDVNSKIVPVERNTSAESEIEELGSRSTWAGTGIPIAPHVRGARRHSQADIAIDMGDANSSNLLSDMNDKEHGFSALTNSRLVPKATRILADRLDGLWFVGGRILTRQPSARLGLAMYWIIIHVYMAMIFSRWIF